MKKIVASLALAILSSTAFGQDCQQPFESAKKEIKQRLKDPDSAQFRSMFVIKYEGKTGKPEYAVIGQVNAKNSFGGYNGFTYFGTHLAVLSTQPWSTVAYLGQIRSGREAFLFDEIFGPLIKSGEAVCHMD